MSDIDLRVALMESGRMNLMHLPPGAISWLWDRPTKQIDAAESLAVAANAHGNPVVDASLLKADQNVLLIKCEGGECFRIYPDGGFSHNDSPMDIGGCSSVLQGMQQDECPMDDNGHQAAPEEMGDVVSNGHMPMAIMADAGNDEHMDAEPPESGVATPVGMTNLAGEPTMDEADGAGGGLSMGSGSGAPYVGDISMDADLEMENLMMSRELGEASIHMFRNESDDDLSALATALGITEMNNYDDDVENIKLEVYDESLNTYQDVPITVEWSVEPSEFDGQFQSYQGSASVDKMQLAKPVQVNGKVYRQLDDELSGLILATHNSGHTSLYDYVGDEYSGKIEIPQHKYPDSTR